MNVSTALLGLFFALDFAYVPFLRRFPRRYNSNSVTADWNNTQTTSVQNGVDRSKDKSNNIDLLWDEASNYGISMRTKGMIGLGTIFSSYLSYPLTVLASCSSRDYHCHFCHSSHRSSCFVHMGATIHEGNADRSHRRICREFHFSHWTSLGYNVIGKSVHTVLPQTLITMMALWILFNNL